MRWNVRSGMLNAAHTSATWIGRLGCPFTQRSALHTSVRRGDDIAGSLSIRTHKGRAFWNSIPNRNHALERSRSVWRILHSPQHSFGVSIDWLAEVSWILTRVETCEGATAEKEEVAMVTPLSEQLSDLSVHAKNAEDAVAAA